jgi:hypothetical protein
LSSDLDSNPRGEKWWGPRCQRIGILGQPGGPSIELVRKGMAARFEFKIEEEQQKRLAAPTPTPPLIVDQSQHPRGTATFTSGLQRWSDPRPKPPEPPEPTEQPKPPGPVKPPGQAGAKPEDYLPF